MIIRDRKIKMRKLLRWSIQIFLSGIFLFMFTTTISKKHILLSNDSQFNQKFQVNENQILINNKKREFGNISNIEKYSPTHVNFSQDSFIFMHIQVLVIHFILIYFHRHSVYLRKQAVRFGLMK